MTAKMERILGSGREYNFISMDLGTTNTLVYVNGQGIIYNERSLIAYNVVEKMILGIGNTAFDLLGKENPSIKVIAPLADGVIADLEAANDLLTAIFDRIKSLATWENAIVLLASPSSISEIERGALYMIAKNLGAKYVFVEEEVKMAALGSGLNIETSRGQMVIDIGGGTTDIALISAGDVVMSKSIKVAGNWFNEHIIEYCRTKHGVEIGKRTSEKVKVSIGNLEKPREGQPDIKMSTLAHGRNTHTGRPVEFKLSAKEVRDVLLEGAKQILEIAQEILREAPAELAADLIDTGITITGGGALIRGIDVLFEKRFKLPTYIGKDPLKGVLNGTIRYQETIVNRIESGSFVGLMEEPKFAETMTINNKPLKKKKGFFARMFGN